MDAYDKASEVWCLLHKAEQLIINDNDYHPSVAQSISNCLTVVETLQHKLETTTTTLASDYIQAAKKLHPRLLIDEEPETVDITDDGLGAYVQAQTWIPANSLSSSAPAQAGE